MTAYNDVLIGDIIKLRYCLRHGNNNSVAFTWVRRKLESLEMTVTDRTVLDRIFRRLRDAR